MFREAVEAKVLEEPAGVDMSKIPILEPGESIPFVFDRGANSIDGWTCTVSVKQKPSDTSFITPRVIAPTNSVWEGFLTQTELNGLASGLYFVIALLQNTTTDEEEVVRERTRFRITEAWT